MKVQVYLNTQRSAAMDGFTGVSALRKALDFTTFEVEPDSPAERGLLGVISDELNRDIPITGWGTRYRVSRNRNLTTGDVAVLGTRAFALAPHAKGGWQRITTNALLDALHRTGTYDDEVHLATL